MIRQERIPKGMQSLVIPRDGRRDVLGVELVSIPPGRVIRALWDGIDGVLYTSEQVSDMEAVQIVALLSPESVSDEALRRLGLERPRPPQTPMPEWKGITRAQMREVFPWMSDATIRRLAAKEEDDET